MNNDYEKEKRDETIIIYQSETNSNKSKVDESRQTIYDPSLKNNQKLDGFALASLILALIGLVSTRASYGLVPIAAIICASIGINNTNENGTRGKLHAIIAILLAVLEIIIGILFIGIFVGILRGILRLFFR